MKIALDPTPFHHDYELLDFPRLVAELGYEYLQLTPHRDFIPFFNHPRADDDLVAKFRKACADAGVGSPRCSRCCVGRVPTRTPARPRSATGSASSRSRSTSAST